MVIGGTLAIHTLFIVAVDVLTVTHPYEPPPPAPRIGLIDIKVEPAPKPPSPPIRPSEPPTSDPPTVVTRTRTVREPQTRTAPPSSSEPPPTADPGGAPTIAIPDLAPSATGVAVPVGKRTTGPIGRGGSGTGTGTSVGSGAGAPPPPMSVATIKTRALPKGDYGYIDAGKDYPVAARQLGIEGPIRVKLVVDAAGTVKSAVLLNRLGHGLDELALERANKIEFEPAKDTDDHPVSSVVIWTFNMTLPK